MPCEILYLRPAPTTTPAGPPNHTAAAPEATVADTVDTATYVTLYTASILISIFSGVI